MSGKVLIYAVILVVIIAGSAPGREDDPTAQLRQTQSLISSINLLNGLHLSGEQVQRLLEINREAEMLRQQFLADNAGRLAEAERHYKALVDNFSRDRQAPEETERTAQQLKRELEEAEEAYRERLAQFGDEIEQMLTYGQREILATFKPCLIPPRDLREPSRAGQASPSGRGEKILKQYRAMMQRAEEMEKRARSRSAVRRSGYYGRNRPRGDARMFSTNRARERFAERFFPRYFEMIERVVGEMSEEQKVAERDRILAVLDRAADMSEEDFSLNIDTLAAELTAPLEESENEIREAAELLASRRGRPGRAARFLISADLIPILEKRAEQYAHVQE